MCYKPNIVVTSEQPLSDSKEKTKVNALCFYRLNIVLKSKLTQCSIARLRNRLVYYD